MKIIYILEKKMSKEKIIDEEPDMEGEEDE